MDIAENKKGKNASSRNERIFLLTTFGRKMLKIFFMLFLILFASSMLLFHWQLLTENPFSVKLHWNRPTFACRNIHSDLVVVDNNGKRVVVLSPSGKIRSQFHANPFSQKAISSVMDAAVDDKYIYVLDLKHSANGAQIDGERVVVYDLNGTYIDTIFEILHPDAKQREHVLCDVSCYNGKVFVTKREKGILSVYQIVDKKLQLVHELKLPGKVIFSASYMPDTKSTYVVTRDACYYLKYLNDVETLSIPDSRTHWNDVAISPSGDRYYLDSNRHEIIRFRPNGKKRELIQISSRDEIKIIPDVYGLWMSLQDDVLTWCCTGKNEVIVYNTVTGEKTVLSNVPQTTSFLLFKGFIWLCAILMFILIVKNGIKGLVNLIINIRRHRDPDLLQNTKVSGDHFNMLNMYGQNLLTLMFAFVAVLLIIFCFFGEQGKQTMTGSVKNTASELRNLPGFVFGDYLAKIDSPKDYNSKKFKIMHQVASSICFSSEGATFDLGFSVMRKLPTGEYMYIIDNSDCYPIGKRIQANDPNHADLYSTLSNLKDDELKICGQSRQTGSSVYYVLTKVFDSDGQEAGIVMISFNRDKVYIEIRNMMMKLSVDLLLLFIIFILFSGEIRLVLEFHKLRKTQPGTGKLQKTVCEAHRSCLGTTIISLYLDAAFLPTLVVELAKAAGVKRSSTFLAAFPLSLRSFMLVAALVLGGSLAKYRPALFLKCSSVLSVLCYIFQIHAVHAGQYAWFIVGIAVLGILHGLKLAALDAISSSGLQPDPRFKNLVFVNTECLIGAAVGTSVGSLLCAKFGYTSVFAFNIYLECTLFFLTNTFIANDINIHGALSSLIHNTKQTLLSDIQKIKTNIRHATRPELLTLLFCVMVPVSVLGQFDSYALPVYNAWSGYSQLLTGFTGTVTKVLALIMIPYIFNRLAARGNRLPIFCGMFALLIGLIYFAFDTSLTVMGVLLLIITISNIVFTTSAERLRLAVAAEDNLKYSDVVGFSHAFQYLAASIAPILMGFFLKFGFRIFALIFAVLILVCLIVFYFFSSHFRRAELGSSI